jgi:hypothetical protein
MLPKIDLNKMKALASDILISQLVGLHLILARDVIGDDHSVEDGETLFVVH